MEKINVISLINRIDREDYPYYAIREALINAVVHRDYSFTGSTLIHIFEDRIEFVSVGGLVSRLTLDDIMLGISESRKDIEMELNLSKSTINLLLNKLLKEGKIEQEGKGKNIRYSIKNKLF